MVDIFKAINQADLRAVVEAVNTQGIQVLLTKNEDNQSTIAFVRELIEDAKDLSESCRKRADAKPGTLEKLLLRIENLKQIEAYIKNTGLTAARNQTMFSSREPLQALEAQRLEAIRAATARTMDALKDLPNTNRFTK